MIKKTYVDTSAGQVHLRTSGDGDPVLLLHWTPASGRQYEPLMSAMSDRDYRMLAPDLIGYGRSDHKAGVWLIQDFARNLRELLDELGIETVKVVGGHVSSEIATELALQDERVTHVVLDGCPVWSKEQREQILNSAITEAPDANPEGELASWAWNKHLWLMKVWNPEYALDSSPSGPFIDAYIDYLETKFDTSGAETLRAYDFDDALKQLTIPTLALTATTDPLNNCFQSVLYLVPNCQGFEFSGVHPLHKPEVAGTYAQVINAFFSGVDLPDSGFSAEAGLKSSYV